METSLYGLHLNIQGNLTYFDYVMKSRFCVPHLFMCVSGVTGSITHACLLFKYIVYYFDSGRVQQEIKIEYALVSTTCLTIHYASQVPLWQIFYRDGIKYKQTNPLQCMVPVMFLSISIFAELPTWYPPLWKVPN